MTQLYICKDLKKTKSHTVFVFRYFNRDNKSNSNLAAIDILPVINVLNRKLM